MLIDSSLIIDFLRRKDKRGSWFHSLIASDKQLMVSVITQAELYAGKSVWEKKRARDELGLIFSALRILPLSEEIAISAGKIRAIYGVDLIDSLIAATAISKSVSLATMNYKHFKSITNLKLASVKTSVLPSFRAMIGG